MHDKRVQARPLSRAKTFRCDIGDPESLSPNARQRLLHSYHKDNPAEVVERSALPLENFNASGRQIATMFLTKAIYFSRAIIDSVTSRNLLIAFQSMRALVEAVTAVRYTLEKLELLVREGLSRGIVTGDQAHQLNYEFLVSHPPPAPGAVDFAFYEYFVPHPRDKKDVARPQENHSARSQSRRCRASHTVSSKHRSSTNSSARV